MVGVVFYCFVYFVDFFGYAADSADGGNLEHELGCAVNAFLHFFTFAFLFGTLAVLGLGRGHCIFVVHNFNFFILFFFNAKPSQCVHSCRCGFT